MIRASKRILSLTPSATFAMAQKCAELTISGIDIINMSVGEPDFPTPNHIKEAANNAINEGFTRYSPVSGYGSLKDAICGKLLRENGLSYSGDEILVSNGAKQSLCNAIMAMINDDDEVIIPAPYWVSYPQMVLLAGGKPIFIETGIEQNYKITARQLENAITPKTRMIILCSPSNPSGAVYSKSELEELSEVVSCHDDIMVLSDEIYEHLNYVGAHASIASCHEMRNRTIIVNGVSKAYAMTGWRIGFMAAPREVVSVCNILQGQYTSGPSSISQKAAEAAWNGPQECVEEMRLAFMRRRDLLVCLMREIPGLEVNVPDGAFYLFPKCSSFYGKKDGKLIIRNSSDLAMFLLKVGHVATVGGDAFGAPDYFRLSYATSEDNIREAAKRIKEALSRLR